jgi:hypothetical protein
VSIWSHSIRFATVVHDFMTSSSTGSCEHSGDSRFCSEDAVPNSTSDGENDLPCQTCCLARLHHSSDSFLLAFPKSLKA